MKQMFREFNRFCLKMDIFELKYMSIDGNKFRASTSLDFLSERLYSVNI